MSTELCGVLGSRVGVIEDKAIITLKKEPHQRVV